MGRRRTFVFVSCFLIGIQVFTVKTETERKLESCNQILRDENHDMWTNLATLNSIFYHVFKTGCMACARPECDYYSPECTVKWASLGIIPVYNNILEFGLSGKYFPRRATIRLSFNKKCYFYITVYTKEKKSVVLKLDECYSADGSCVNIHTIVHPIMFDNQYCLYFGLAIYKIDKIHITSSGFCNTFASANFDELGYVRIKREECYYKHGDKMEAEYRFEQENDRKFDGVPVILPCSPGGFVVDPKTGRFIIGQTCWKMFSDSKRYDMGINFLIENLYHNNEDLLFPKRDYRNAKEFRPIYIDQNGRAIRKSMNPINKTNEEKGNRKRVICEYEELTKGKLGTCGEMLKSVSKGSDEKAINLYLSKSSGCFACAKPKCDYYSSSCANTTATLSLPLYQSLLEFGLSGQYFPLEGVARLTLTENCVIKIHIAKKAENITITLHKCPSSKNSDNQCEELDVQSNSDKILFNNWYCVHVALAFHEPNKVYYAFSFRCDKFAGSQFNESVFITIDSNSCFNENFKERKVDFEFLQDKNRTIDGVPIILPCSPGGYAVNTETGKFLVNETCDDIFWETLINRTKTSGIHFIIKKIYDRNENLMFPKREDVDTNYPYPIYIKKNGQASSPQEMAFKIVPNTELRKKFREKCLYKRETDLKELNLTNSLNNTSTGKPGAGTESGSDSSVGSLVIFNDNNMLICTYMHLC